MRERRSLSIPMTFLMLAATVAAFAGENARLPNGRISVLVELGEPAAAEVWQRELDLMRVSARALASNEASTARAAAASRTQIAIAESEQRAFVETLSAASIAATEVFRVQRLLNAVALEVDENDLVRLAALPGVKAVHLNPPEVPANSTSVPWIGAPVAWQDLGVTGKDVRVGVIDSGIDYLHRHFGGSGSYTGQQFDDSVVPWNDKVVGGTDLCGDAYDGQSANLRPDGDPMDCGDNGHGTHVAGSLAGYGVTTTGQTYQGPWVGGLSPSIFGIGPGVAPEAKLYAIRIFGCSGSTTLTVQALDWASDPNRDGNFSDRLDVVNMSLGSSYGTANPSARSAIDRLAGLGSLVVVSAGNSGDLYNIVGGPSTADNALSVASCADDGLAGARLRVEEPAALAGEMPSAAAAFGAGPPPGGLTAQVAAAVPADGCTALTNPGELAGRIALIDRGTCNFVVKVKNAQLAGATAAIVANNQGGALVSMGGEDASITIPSVFISQLDGSTLRSALGGGVVASLRQANLAATIASSSSRGPRVGDLVLKPEITAPGVSITSARARGGAASATFSGTSMAAPHTAGVAALVKQRRPEWSTAELKSAIMSTARAVLTVPAEAVEPLHGAGRVGAGLVDPAAAATTELLAMDDEAPGRVALSFGAVEGAGVVRVRRTVRLVNKGSAPQNLELGFRTMAGVPGVEVELPAGRSVTVPAGGAVTVPVELVVDAARVVAVRDPGAVRFQDGLARHYLVEHSGHLTITPGSGSEIRLPLHAVVRPASTLALDAPASGLLVGSSATVVELPFAGQALGVPGGEPEGAVAVASVLDLVWASTGAPPASQAHGSLRWLGLGSDAPARGGVANATVLFGIATHGAWPSPRDVKVVITVDSGADGTNDWTITTSDYGSFLSAGQTTTWTSDVYGAKVCQASGSQCPHFTLLNRVAPGTAAVSLFGSEVMLIAVPATVLGLTDARSQIRVQVHVEAVGGSRQSDSSQVTYDVARPGFSPQIELPPHALGPNETLPMRVDRQAFESRQTAGLLLLHHNNAAGARAEAVAVAFADCSLAACPEVVTTVVAAARTVTFAATPATACTGVEYEWSIGGEAPVQAGATITRVLDRPGTYPWRLTVRAEGQSCTREGQVTVPAVARRRLGR